MEEENGFDPYEVLQVSPNAEVEVIQAAYRKLALKYHPDRGGDGVAEHMKRLNRAKDILLDPEKKAAFDRVRNEHQEVVGSSRVEKDSYPLMNELNNQKLSTGDQISALFKPLYERAPLDTETLQRLRDHLTAWADGIPHHPHRNFGTEIAIQDIEYVPHYYIRLQSQYESRVVQRVEKPYTGWHIPALCTNENNIDIWSYNCPTAEEFQESEETYPIEDSQEVASCEMCHGAGHVKCPSCRGRGDIACGKCRGNGTVHKVRYVQKQKKCSCSGGQTIGRNICSKCNGAGWYTGNVPEVYDAPCDGCRGTGKVECEDCSGTGRVECSHCEGHGKLVSLLVLTDSFAPKEDSFDYRNPQCIEDVTSSVDKGADYRAVVSIIGNNVVLETVPPADNKGLFKAALKVLAEAASRCSAERKIARQRLWIGQADVVQLKYAFQGRQYDLRLIGTKRKAHASKSPFITFIEDSLRQGNDKLETGEVNDGLKILQKCLDMQQADHLVDGVFQTFRRKLADAYAIKANASGNWARSLHFSDRARQLISNHVDAVVHEREVVMRLALVTFLPAVLVAALAVVLGLANDRPTVGVLFGCASMLLGTMVWNVYGKHARSTVALSSLSAVAAFSTGVAACVFIPPNVAYGWVTFIVAIGVMFLGTLVVSACFPKSIRRETIKEPESIGKWLARVRDILAQDWEHIKESYPKISSSDPSIPDTAQPTAVKDMGDAPARTTVTEVPPSNPCTAPNETKGTHADGCLADSAAVRTVASDEDTTTSIHPGVALARGPAPSPSMSVRFWPWWLLWAGSIVTVVGPIFSPQWIYLAVVTKDKRYYYSGITYSIATVILVVIALTIGKDGQSVAGGLGCMMCLVIWWIVQPIHFLKVRKRLLAKSPQPPASAGKTETQAAQTAVRCGNGNKAILEPLLANGAEVNKKDTEGRTPLGLASKKGHKAAATLLRRQDGSATQRREALCSIHDAVRNNDLETVKALLKDNPDLVFSKGGGGGTPLHLAVTNDYKELAQLLLADRADVNAKSEGGLTPLHAAVLSDHKDMVELLLSKKAEVNAGNDEGLTPLHFAAMNGSKKMAELLLSNGAEVNAKTNDGGTPLQAAAAMEHEAVVKLLRTHGGVATHRREAPCSIHDAVRNDDLETVKVLLKDNPNLVFSKEEAGLTPLHLAAVGGYTNMAQLLLSNKADVNAANNDGVTPLHLAVGVDHNDMAELLLAHEADVNAASNSGMTPLHFAAMKGYKEMAELLLTNKADVNAKSDSGATPRLVAKLKGHKDMANLLHEHGGHE